MSNYTPGPWEQSRKNGRVIVACNESANEKVATAANTDNPPVTWANVRLIAAAPEMLEALERVKNDLVREMGYQRYVRNFLFVEEAIAKAGADE